MLAAALVLAACLGGIFYWRPLWVIDESTVLGSAWPASGASMFNSARSAFITSSGARAGPWCWCMVWTGGRKIGWG